MTAARPFRSRLWYRTTRSRLTRFRLPAGMSLREYYAGQAMTGFIAGNSTGNIARASVTEADNLLAELRGEK